MSSSSGVPRIGTRIEPYSRAHGLGAQRRLGDDDPAQDRHARRAPVGRRRARAGRHPDDPDVAGALVEDEQADEAAGRHRRAEHGRQRQVAAADAHRERDPVGPRPVGLAVAQDADRDVRDHEREHRAERVDAREASRSRGTTSARRQHRRDDDHDVRRRRTSDAGARARSGSGGWSPASTRAARARASPRAGDDERRRSRAPPSCRRRRPTASRARSARRSRSPARRAPRRAAGPRRASPAARRPRRARCRRR